MSLNELNTTKVNALKKLGAHPLINKTQLACYVFPADSKNSIINSFNKFKQRKSFTQEEIVKALPALNELNKLFGYIIEQNDISVSKTLNTDSNLKLEYLENEFLKLSSLVNKTSVENVTEDYQKGYNDFIANINKLD